MKKILIRSFVALALIVSAFSWPGAPGVLAPTAAHATTTAIVPVAVVRQSATEIRVRIQVVGRPDNEFYEFQLTDRGSGLGWALKDIRVRDPSTGVSYYLNQADSTFEYAVKPGVKNAADTEANWPAGGYQGGAHGNQSVVSVQARGVSFGVENDAFSQDVGQGYGYQKFRLIQTFKTFLPSNGTTRFGSTVLIHEFDASGLLISHIHYVSDPTAFQYRRSFTAMLPMTNVGGAGINTVKIGGETPYTVQANGTDVVPSTAWSTVEAWHTSAHPYHLFLELPSGGPDSTGSWGFNSTKKIWLRDNPSISGTPAYAKIYVNWVAEEYANRVPAASSTHQARYYVTRP